jgi:allophanate hydrolase subunit 2
MDNNILDATQLDLTWAHPEIVDAIKQVANGKPIILHQDGYQVAAVISISDLHLLERLIEEEEDRIDIAEVKEILAEVKEQGTVPWQEVKAKLGL